MCVKQFQSPTEGSEDMLLTGSTLFAVIKIPSGTGIQCTDVSKMHSNEMILYFL